MENNKTGIKNKGGRPLKFKTEELLQQKIDEYFKSCWEQKVDMWGNPLFWKNEKGDKLLDKPIMRQIKPYTIGGLAVFLDCDRDLIANYKAKGKYIRTIKRALDIIYCYKEERLHVASNPTGTIFDLKNNYGWKDKQEIDSKHSGNLTVIEKTYVLPKDE